MVELEMPDGSKVKVKKAPGANRADGFFACTDMLKAKKGGFHVAIAAQVPILPISLQGSHAIFPKGSLNMKPGTISLTIHPPISTEGDGVERLPELIEKVRGVIAMGLA